MASVAPVVTRTCVGIDVEAVEAALVLGDRLAQRRDADARRVLVDPAGDVGGGVGEQRRRAVGVGEALPEVDRAGAQGQRRHLGEDRRRERLHTRHEHAVHSRLARHDDGQGTDHPADRLRRRRRHDRVGRQQRHPAVADGAGGRAAPRRRDGRRRDQPVRRLRQLRRHHVRARGAGHTLRRRAAGARAGAAHPARRAAGAGLGAGPAGHRRRRPVAVLPAVRAGTAGRGAGSGRAHRADRVRAGVRRLPRRRSRARRRPSGAGVQPARARPDRRVRRRRAARLRRQRHRAAPAARRVRACPDGAVDRRRRSGHGGGPAAAGPPDAALRGRPARAAALARAAAGHDRGGQRLARAQLAVAGRAEP